MLNCGLVALEQMSKLKNISMFTLIHLAKDNGVNLYFCKVEKDDLIKVNRPAIFHQANHFVFVDNDMAMPRGDYTGYVLTTRPPNEPLPYSLAKKIQGQGILSSIGSMASRAVSSARKAVTSVASNVRKAAAPVVSRVASAARSVASSAPVRSIGNVVRGITSVVRSSPAISAAKATPTSSMRYVGSPSSSPSSSVFNRGAVSASNVASGGNGLLSTLSKFGSNVAQGVGNVVSNIGSNLRSGANAIAGGVGSLASGGISVSGAKPGSPISGVSNSSFMNQSVGVPGRGVSSLPGSPGGSFSVKDSFPAYMASGGGSPIQLNEYGDKMGGYNERTMIRNSGVGTDPNNPFGFWQGMSGGGNTGSAGGGDNGQGGFGGEGGSSNYQDLTGYNNSAMDNYTAAAKFLGAGGLPSATRDQLNQYASMSLEDLTKQFSQADDKSARLLDEKHQQEKDALMTQYANYGQDPMTSSDAQRRLADLDRQYNQAKAELQQSQTNQAQDKAIQFKKEILANSLQQGQFDYNAAMDLARQLGLEKNLKYAMDNQDHEAMQNVLMALFQR